MSKLETLMEIATRLPNKKIEEVVDFASFLLNRNDDALNTALMSEQALAQSWLSPEDEEAWKDL